MQVPGSANFWFSITLAILGLCTAGGAAREIAVSKGLTSQFDRERSQCRFYWCEEAAVLAEAYKRQLSGRKTSLDSAAGILKNSLARDPASAYRWVDLAQALADQGDLTNARFCTDKAAQLGPGSADVLLAVGDLYLRLGDTAKGLRYLSRTLDLTPELNEALFSHFAARSVSVADALKFAIPQQQKEPGEAYLRYLIQQKDFPGARTVWAWLEAKGFGDRRIAGYYSNFLFNANEFADAARVWRQGAHVPPPEEYVWNGNFSTEPDPDEDFDWRILPFDHGGIERECAAGTNCSLRVEFDGTTNTDFRNVSEVVVVPPGHYRFKAMVKTDGISTDEGPYFRVEDGEDPKRLTAATTPGLGTADWHISEMRFDVPPVTRYLRVTLIRRSSLRFDSHISGKIWVRAVSIQAG